MADPRNDEEENISLSSISTSAASRASPRNAEEPITFAPKYEVNNDNNVTCNEYYPEGDKRNIGTTIITEEPARKQPLWRKVYSVVYPDYVLDHLNYKSFKVVIQSWTHLYPSAILSIVPKTSTWLGGAPYLTMIVSFIGIAGGGSVIMNVLTAILMLIGALISFVHHVVRSKIINDLHGGITQQELVQSLITEGVCQAGPELTNCITEQVFSGRYIETKAVAVTMISMIINTVILGNIRRLHPLGNMCYIMGQIGNVIFSCYGHFSPLYEPLQIGFTVLKPLGCGLLLKVGAGFFVFPSTSNFKYIAGMQGVLTQLKQASEKNMRLFMTMKPSAPNFANYKAFKKEMTSIRSKTAPLEILASTVWLEYSYGRFDVGDVGQLRSLTKNLITSTASYAHFFQLLQERTFFAKDDFTMSRRRSTVSSLTHGHAKIYSAFQDSYKKVGEYEHKKRLKTLRNRFMHQGLGRRLRPDEIDEIAELLTHNLSPFLDVSNKAQSKILEWLNAANHFRIFALVPWEYKKHVARQKEMAEKVKEVKRELVETLAKFENVDVLKDMMIDSNQSEEWLLFLISQGVLFLQIARHQCENLVKLIDLLIDLDERRPTPKFITYFTKNKYSKPRHLTSDLDEEVPDYLRKETQSRDADNLPPSNFAQYVGLYLTKVFYFLISDRLWFWIRAGGLICIGAIPYFVRTTAHWYYSNRMVWLVIMIAVSISESTGQTTYVFISKLIYTFAGCLLGLVCWYISCGSAAGNYYGYGAVTGVIFLYLIFFRHFSVHQTLLPQILFGVTTILVLGTSWLDARGSMSANVGYGWRPAYIRFVSVVIGLCIGSLTAILPKPKSSKHIVRQILSSSLSEVGNIHCDVAKFAVKRSNDPSYHILERHDILLARFRYHFMKIASLNTLLVPLRFELPIAGYWPESKYLRLQGLIGDTVQLYSMMLIAINELDDPVSWVPIIIKRVGFCYSELDAEIFSLIHMASDAIKSKEALPKITEANVSLRHLELLSRQWGINKISLSERFYSSKSVDAEGHGAITEHLDYHKFFSRDGQLNILSLLIAHMIYNRLDEIMIVVKGLVGEMYDFDENILIEDDSEDEEAVDDLERG
ncbi:hypothetical protein KGF57_003204 [Candida theae]|uniref:ER transporter 6TM N-terminal domain-containing protein n=1 Tax=Candida theae TaxID=1198502 RepID=A0AAD5BDB8_9ASCO|nr:uncharacterized protein KGF57_003204 [Candida theae]KAI5957510.1 hypothetical protein KGF57_003204 [Candida theae]